MSATETIQIATDVCGAHSLHPVVRQPRRIQLSRKKGWRMPENTVIVDRRSEWGNPYGVGPEQSAAVVVEKFEAFVMRRPEWIEAARQYLRGKNLACWCKLDAPCHADVWIRLANDSSSATRHTGAENNPKPL
jgi:hypothetical protein